MIESYCTGNRRYKAAEPLSPEGVVLHSIGTPQPAAKVLRDYWDRDASPYVVHYVVDDEVIYHCMPDAYKCWHVGSPGNARFLSVEMCEPSAIQYTSGAAFKILDLGAAQTYAAVAYQNAVWLLAALCTAHGWDPNVAIWTHGEITKQGMSDTDHVDPEHLWNGLGMGLSLLQLRRDVRAAMTTSAAAAAGSTSAAAVAADAAQKIGALYRVRKTWDDPAGQIGAFTNLSFAKAACKDGYAVFDENGIQVYPLGYLVRVTAQSGLNVRRGPGTDYGVAMAVPKGGAYTVVEEQDGWGLLKAYQSGRDGWISLRYTERV
ncbi:MAG: N-acetylmuramoyl-L-alanine amidase [Oscillospiraceae bacterium]|nr:N-acetylmuramoyl-L-alanine amidase [Oscillospiraceae bacterium]